MKIALFHDFLVRMGGAEHVFFTLADQFPEADIYTLFQDKAALEARYPGRNIHVHSGAQKCYSLLSKLPVFGSQTTKVLLPFYGRWVEEIDFSTYDLVLVSSTAWAHGIVTPVDTTVVCYMHSPARFLWDYYPLYKKELGSKGHTHWKDLLLTKILSRQRLWSALAGERADLLLSNSVTVQERIAKFYRRDDVEVLYPPVDVSGIRCTGKNTKGPVVIIATLTPYKNIDAILTWWGDREEQLVIIGDGPDRKRLESLAGKNITFLGYVSFNKRNQMLEKARCIIYPSKEDFGIVPVEAMAAGKLTLALGEGGACETLEDGRTGILFSNLLPGSLQDAWERFLSLEKRYDKEELRKSAERFRTENFLERLQHLLEKKI